MREAVRHRRRHTGLVERSPAAAYRRSTRALTSRRYTLFAGTQPVLTTASAASSTAMTLDSSPAVMIAIIAARHHLGHADLLTSRGGFGKASSRSAGAATASRSPLRIIVSASAGSTPDVVPRRPAMATRVTPYLVRTFASATVRPISDDPGSMRKARNWSISP